MTLALCLLAAAAAAAIRGVYSPCGLSMLSTITPMGERARGSSFAWTATAFVLGATGGGLLLGGSMAAAAACAGAVPWDARDAACCAVVAVCAAGDVQLFGLRLWDHPRQVDVRWVQRFRPWVYGSGFGAQLGVGIATYVMTNATYAIIAGGVLFGRPSVALGVGATYGTVRGLTILLGLAARSPERLQALHAALSRLEPVSRWLALLAELCVLAAAIVADPSPLARGVLVASACLVSLVCLAAAARGALRARVTAAT